MALFTAEAAIPAAATSLYTLLGLTDVDRKKACEVRIQNANSAANPLYVGFSSALTVAANRGAELAAGGVWQVGDPAHTKLDLTQIFVIGTVAGANVVFVSIVY